MIVYLSTSASVHKFEFLEEGNVVNRQEKSEMTGEQLRNFIKTDLRNLKIDLLIIDLEMMKDSQDENILVALSTYQVLFTESKILLFHRHQEKLPDLLKAQYPVYGEHDVEEALRELLNPQIMEEEQVEKEEENIFKEEEKEHSNEPEAEMVMNESEPEHDLDQLVNQKVKTHEGIPLGKRCLEQQKTEANAKINPTKRKLTKLDYVWTCRNVVIAVVGTQRRTGVTTEAIRLSSHLNRLGASVCYSEAVLDGHRHLASIAAEEELEKIESGYQKENLILYLDSMYDTEAGFNFIVLDLGSIEERPKWIISVLKNVASEVVLMASGVRQYEVETLNTSVELLTQTDIRINVIVQGKKNHVKLLKEQYEGTNVLIHSGEYEPDIFVSTSAEPELVELLQAHNL